MKIELSLREAFSPEDYIVVMDFAKSYIEYPHRRLNKALIIAGSEGCGKTSLIQLFTKNTVGVVHHASHDDILNRFNSWLAGRRLVVVEEFTHSCDFVLKSLILNDKLKVMGMQKEDYTAVQSANFICATSSGKRHTSRAFRTVTMHETMDSDDRQEFMFHMNSTSGMRSFLMLVRRHKFTDGFFENSGFYK